MDRIRMRLLAIAGLVALCPAHASAGEVILGAGVDDVFDRWQTVDMTAGFGIEVRTDPLYVSGRFALAAGAAAEADLDGDLWGGAGAVATFSEDVWRVGASVMPGLYEQGDGNDLGGAFEIRTMLFVDRAVSQRARIGLALGHKSNAYTGDFNPGIETLFVTLGWEF